MSLDFHLSEVERRHTQCRNKNVTTKWKAVAAELGRENVRYRKTLLAIADEAAKHHEHNAVSGKDRLPKGYTKILNHCCNAIGD